MNLVTMHLDISRRPAWVRSVSSSCAQDAPLCRRKVLGSWLELMMRQGSALAPYLHATSSSCTLHLAVVCRLGKLRSQQQPCADVELLTIPFRSVDVDLKFRCHFQAKITKPVCDNFQKASMSLPVVINMFASLSNACPSSLSFGCIHSGAVMHMHIFTVRWIES